MDVTIGKPVQYYPAAETPGATTVAGVIVGAIEGDRYDSANIVLFKDEPGLQRPERVECVPHRSHVGLSDDVLPEGSGCWDYV